MRAVVGFIVVLSFLFFPFFVKSVSAVSVTISVYPSTITGDSFTVTASISGAVTGTNYLRLDFFKDGSDNYFGETYNNTDWYGGSVYSQYFPIFITAGIPWNDDIQGRIGSPSSAQYDGSGTYKIRLRMYVSGAEYTSESFVVSIIAPTSAPILTNTPTPQPTSVPTLTPTKTPTPTSVNTPTPTSAKTPTPSLKTSVTPTLKGISPTGVLGESIQNGLFASQPDGTLPSGEDVLASDTVKKPDVVFKTISIVLGFVFITICVILTIRVIKKGELTQDEEE